MAISEVATGRRMNGAEMLTAIWVCPRSGRRAVGRRRRGRSLACGQDPDERAVPQRHLTVSHHGLALAQAALDRRDVALGGEDLDVAQHRLAVLNDIDVRSLRSLVDRLGGDGG